VQGSTGAVCIFSLGKRPF